MKQLDTRTLQDHLRNSQIEMESCTFPEVRDAYKALIRYIATELLYRYQMEKD